MTDVLLLCRLGLALALQRKNVNCIVFERDFVFEDRRQGYGE